MRPTIALLTDFGTRDHYAGTMKGAVLAVCPEATLVDITHDIAPQDIAGAALELAAAYSYFPDGTIFLVVVDPGVGSTRRALAAQTERFGFVGPDNGVFTLVFDQSSSLHVVELTNPAYARPVVSRTFEGRDRFAPAAGWLATGIALDAFGPRVADYHRLAFDQPVEHQEALAGQIVRIDRFGNLISNIDRRHIDAFAASGTVDVRLADLVIGPIVATYADVAPHTACALFGSSGHLEIAVSGGNARDALRAARGTPVTVRRR